MTAEEGGLLTLRLVFETAWRPPYGWLVALFNRFSLTFDHNWLDEGAEGGVAGRFDFAKLDDLCGTPWAEKPADAALQAHLGALLWGEEAYAEIEAERRQEAGGATLQ